jgi:hypothetical protein
MSNAFIVFINSREGSQEFLARQTFLRNANLSLHRRAGCPAFLFEKLSE